MPVKKKKPQLIACEKDLGEGKTIKFPFRRDGVKQEGVLLRWKGEVMAFENKCQHLPLPLDYGDNRFFTTDGKFLVCQTHWAIYQPDTGLCVQGPCQGASLKKLSLEFAQGKIWLVEPEDTF